MKKTTFLNLLTLFILLLPILASCKMPGLKTGVTPTINITQAYQTVEARLTQGATLTPAFTLTAIGGATTTYTPAPPTATATSTLAASPTSAAPAQSCDLAAPGTPIDVTIPDDTVMQPGQAFTKVWRLQNAGTCTWTKAYSAAFFSGDPLGAKTSIPMPIEVPPGQSVDISVELVAPSTPGTYQSNWKLRNASNQWFGIGPGGGSPFWVKIIVSQTATTSPTFTTPTATTPTVTTTSGPGILVSGAKILALGDKINLDTNQKNSGSGDDLSFDADSKLTIYFVPVNGALIGAWGSTQPSYAECKSASLSSTPLPLGDLGLGMFLCYKTNQGLPGALYIADFNSTEFTVNIQFLTWDLP